MRRAAGVVEVQAVDHHHRLDRDVEPAAAAAEHLADVRVAEEQPAGQLVVLLVERAAGDQDSDAHRCSVLHESHGTVVSAPSDATDLKSACPICPTAGSLRRRR